MTIGEFRNLFESNTVFFLECYDDKSNNFSYLKISNYLWDCETFATMRIIPSSVYVKEDYVYIKADMSFNVFISWLSFSLEYLMSDNK